MFRELVSYHGPFVLSEDTQSSTELANRSQGKKKFRFVQLYTSKSYENRREELVNPPEQSESSTLKRSSSTENLEKHVLSPRLVDAISSTTQVVWANTMKQEGLIGRSDIRLQTAVGMPVAMDSEGNMCIVVMFSPNNIQSTDDAMEYLQSISFSATSSSIPCLLPVFDPNASNLRQLPHADRVREHPDANTLGEGVTARFVSFGDLHPQQNGRRAISDQPEVHSSHELSTAPKDTFGIPMLPSFAELGNSNPNLDASVDVFDEASYGIWSTIMESSNGESQSSGGTFDFQGPLQDDNRHSGQGSIMPDPSLQVILPNKSSMSSARIERLEEFCHAFLGMSVFDLADVWVPASEDGYPDCLRHVMSVSSTDSIEALNNFKRISERALIKFWTGGVGRAYSSGNPVWSAQPNVFVDAGRATAFEMAKVKTVLAVPVFSGKRALPTCVVSCYSLVRSSSVPFVLRFVQQALRLLWDGLDQFEPHKSVGAKLWKDVAPADLGEMAADVEMQQHFLTKKRPHSRISDVSDRRGSLSEKDPSTAMLSSQLQSVRLPSGDVLSVPLQLGEDAPKTSVSEVRVETFQNHLAQAVRSVGDAVPFEHVSTNAEGTKRAHVMGPLASTGNVAAPLPMPRAFPSQVVSSVSPSPPGSVHEAMSVQEPSPSTYAMPPSQQSQNGAFANAVNVNQFNASTVSNLSQPSPTPVVCEPIGAQPTRIAQRQSVKACRIQGCDSPAVARRPYCEKHSGNRLCEHPGCSKCAQGCTRFCIAHGGGRRCTFPGCDKGARDKFFCAAHGGGKRCKHEGCTKSAVGGSSLCTAHGGGRRCAVEGCDKSAQSSTKFCVKHGGGKKCAHAGCEKVARGRTSYCAAHGGGVRCKLEGCNRVAIGKLQLCRAHGGASSRSRRKDTSISPPIPQGSGTAANVAVQPLVLQQEALLHASTHGISVDRMTGI